MCKLAALICFLSFTVGGALAAFSTVQLANNIVPAGGYLLDGAAGFIINDVNGKLFAR